MGVFARQSGGIVVVSDHSVFSRLRELRISWPTNASFIRNVAAVLEGAHQNTPAYCQVVP